jgi:hypothetical protein
MNRGAIPIPPHVPTERELRLLERRTHAGGSETVDAPRGVSEDHANALAGCAYLALSQCVMRSYGLVYIGKLRQPCFRIAQQTISAIECGLRRFNVLSSFLPFCDGGAQMVGNGQLRK